ncbi:MAG: hypothetical protein LBD18_01690 [Treponema sp.]|nr:hypothetical protein [Treponema sp.]
MINAFFGWLVFTGATGLTVFHCRGFGLFRRSSAAGLLCVTNGGVSLRAQFIHHTFPYPHPQKK